MKKMIFTTILILFLTALFGSGQQDGDPNSGMGLSTVILTAILVAFTGLVLMIAVFQALNLFFGRNKKTQPGAKTPPVAATSDKSAAAEIPEDHLVAVAVAVEVYKRLYLINSMTLLSFNTTENQVWKSFNKYRQGKI